MSLVGLILEVLIMRNQVVISDDQEAHARPTGIPASAQAAPKSREKLLNSWIK